MRFSLKKTILFITVACALLTTVLCGCKNPSKSNSDLPFLKVEGELVKNAYGDTVSLRGVNAGGLFVIEQWMNGFVSSYAEGSTITARDHKTTTQVFIERFGAEKTQELWKIYRENWWSEADFENCRNMGINVIRLPFTYMNVDFAAVTDLNNGGKNYDFSAISEFVDKAAEYGIYTILDLHGAYGSQNGKDHSGETLSASQVDFYSNPQKQQLTIDLWKALATHFKDNPNVAAYDILNEPAETTDSGGTQVTSLRHWQVFDKIYDAIREVDTEHIVVFESCWDAENIPQPSQFGWQNCMYSFHHYSGCSGEGKEETHKETVDKKISEITAANFGVPIQMGEFTCYESLQQWEYTLRVMNEAGWHWCTWTYKINNTWGNSPWGVVRVETTRQDKVNAHLDSYETIVEKFKTLKTTPDIECFKFSNNKLLFELLYEYATDLYVQYS